jgi:hypothetical protein
MKYHVLQIAVMSRQNIDLPLNQAHEPQSPPYKNFLMLSPLRFFCSSCPIFRCRRELLVEYLALL